MNRKISMSLNHCGLVKEIQRSQQLPVDFPSDAKDHIKAARTKDGREAPG